MSQEKAQTDGGVIYRRLLGFVFPYWKVFIGSILAMMVLGSTEAAFAAVMKVITGAGFVDKDPETIRWIPLMIIGVFTVKMISGFFSTYGMSWIARQVIKTLRKQMFNQLLRLPSSYFEGTSSGVILSKLLYDVEQVAAASSQVITILIRDTLSIIALLAWMIYISSSLTLIFLIITPVLTILVVFISKRFRKLAKRIQGSMGDISHVSEEAIEGQRVIKIFGGQDYETQQFENVNEYNRRQHMKIVATTAFSTPFIQLLVACAFALIVYMATLPDMRGIVGVDTFVSFMTAMIMLMQPTKRLTTINALLQQGIAAAQSVFDFLDQPQEKHQGGKTISQTKGAVKFEHVSFSYAKDKDKILDDVSLTIEPGQSVAFVGRSGAGKTTLVSLLPRFYEFDEGRIMLDGDDIKDINLNSLRDQIALVSQQVTLFNDTIAHNIAYGALGTVSEEEVIKAAETAHAIEFIRELPEGFNTHVGENGVLLSGGQRQRLAIARAILKNAPILILDEATSALDSESERYIQEALDELMKNRTTLVIAHRLSTIERVDKIMVMEHGKIVEQGKHQELLDKEGIYAGLYNLQFKN
ncbi:MAG: lipid A export permease/ATP-binding protein MsbA [Gammaproteobacteria bacterium]|nr:lipid A export permease/ATP-binding protein MsbA [Gammaproteobacteria bacterium]MDH5777266.1 lipid A export permease/ATP-binding protein MsbA [Gammaproteobacteria bacterium]